TDLPSQQDTDDLPAPSRPRARAVPALATDAEGVAAGSVDDGGSAPWLLNRWTSNGASATRQPTTQRVCASTPSGPNAAWDSANYRPASLISTQRRIGAPCPAPSPPASPAAPIDPNPSTSGSWRPAASVAPRTWPPSSTTSSVLRCSSC